MLTKKIIILSFAFLLSCSSIVTNLIENSWAESVIKKMTLREKIAQMMVYRMNMHYVNFENKDWKELIQLIETDGIGIIQRGSVCRCWGRGRRFCIHCHCHRRNIPGRKLCTTAKSGLNYRRRRRFQLVRSR